MVGMMMSTLMLRMMSGLRWSILAFSILLAPVGITQTQEPEHQERVDDWERVTVEVTPGHRDYDMLQCIKHGLQSLLSNHTQLHSQRCQFKSYANTKFRTIRETIGLADNELLSAISPHNKPYLEFISNSKGGQHFYLSNDKAFFMKTEHKTSIDLLMDNLRRYLAHLERFPHSLLVKYLLLFSVQVDGEDKKYFYVMQNVFSPDENIEKRYDLKGSLINRYEKPVEGTAIQIFKDENFLGKRIHVGEHRNWLLRQIRYDVAFLRTLKVSDYSLLVGYKKLYPEGLNTEPWGTLCDGPNTQPCGTLHKHGAVCVSELRQSCRSGQCPLTIDNNYSCPQTTQYPTSLNGSPSDGSHITAFPHYGSHITAFPHVSWIRSRGENLRLLPHHLRPQHVLDGPNYRYYLGLIDFCARNRTRMPPQQYASRFISFLDNHIT